VNPFDENKKKRTGRKSPARGKSLGRHQGRQTAQNGKSVKLIKLPCGSKYRVSQEKKRHKKGKKKKEKEIFEEKDCARENNA